MAATVSPQSPVPPQSTVSPQTTDPFPLTRGRIAALVIGVPLCLLLVAYSGFDLLANFGQGRYPVSYKVPASARSLALNVAAGHVLIKQTASSQATLTGTARYSLVRSKVTESTANGQTAVGYRCYIPVGDCELDATVNIPAGLPVTADTGGGDVTVTGTAGPVKLSTGGGDIAADHTTGPLTLNTSGGDISAAAISSATMTATTGGGNIDATGLNSTTVTARTSGGNIQASGVTSAALTASTGGGDITIVFTSVPRDVLVNTSGGNITLVLPPGSTEYRVNTHTDGSVTDSLRTNTLSTSGNVITATSGGGDITLRYPQQ
jgi:Toastrack DUF4097